jgi:hypothetical protein
VQFLHSPGVQILPAGALNAIFACSPGCNYFHQASRYFLPSGQNAIFACRPASRFCIPGKMQELPSGQSAKFTLWLLEYDFLFDICQSAGPGIFLEEITSCSILGDKMVIFIVKD